jgi:protein-tyrosine phosphatase
MAEGILQQKVNVAGLNWIVGSAGTNGYHNGEPPHFNSQKVCSMNGIDISHQRSRPFVAQDFERYDLIYAMAKDVVHGMQRIAKKKFSPAKTELILNLTHPGENRDVPDPWYGPEPGYHIVFDMLDKACQELINKYLKIYT